MTLIFTVFDINFGWNPTNWLDGWFDLCVLSIGVYDFALFSVEFRDTKLKNWDIFGIKEIINFIKGKK